MIFDKHALRTRVQVALHQLRIGIKTLPCNGGKFFAAAACVVGRRSERTSDLLGEAHDLDVLWATAIEIQAFPTRKAAARWRKVECGARQEDRALSGERMVGRESLWRVWRAVAFGSAAARGGYEPAAFWAGYLDPDFAHSQRVAQLALLLYDGLQDAGLVGAGAATGSAGALARITMRERYCRRRRSCMTSAKQGPGKSIRKNLIG